MKLSIPYEVDEHLAATRHEHSWSELPIFKTLCAEGDRTGYFVWPGITVVDLRPRPACGQEGRSIPIMKAARVTGYMRGCS